MNPLSFLSLLKNPWVLLLIVSVAGVGGTGWYRMRWEGEVAARATEHASAEQAARAAEEKATSLSNELVIAQAEAMAVTEKTVTVYRDRISNDPKTNSCGPVMRDAARGVLDTLRAGGGAPPTQRGAASGVRAAPTGR